MAGQSSSADLAAGLNRLPGLHERLHKLQPQLLLDDYSGDRLIDAGFEVPPPTPAHEQAQRNYDQTEREVRRSAAGLVPGDPATASALARLLAGDDSLLRQCVRRHPVERIGPLYDHADGSVREVGRRAVQLVGRLEDEQPV